MHIKAVDSTKLGILSLGAEIEMFPSESDTNWTTVYFSGQKAYVQTKYIKKTPYKVTDISKPRIADIVDDQIQMSWNAGKNNVSYSCSIVTTKGKVLWSDKNYKTNKVLIKRKYIEGNTALDIKVQATDKNGKKGKLFSKRIFLPGQGRKLNKKRLVIGKNITRKVLGAAIGQSLQLRN